MNRNLNTLSMTEAAMISGVLVIFAIISAFLFSPVMFFYPVPAIILSKRRSTKYAVLSLTVAAMIITIIFGIQLGLMFAVLYSPLAAVMSYMVFKNKESIKTILYGAITFLLSFVAMITIIDLITGVNIIQQIVNLINEVFDIYKEVFSSLPEQVQGSVENSDQFIDYLEQVRLSSVLAVSNLFPSMLISMSVVVAWANYTLASKFGSRFKADIIPMQGLSRFSFPKSFIVAMAGLLLLASALNVFKFNVTIIQMNLLMLCYMAMFVQGISVLKFMIIKRKIGKALSVIVILMVLFVGPIAQIMVVLGMADLILNMRKLENKGV